MKHIIITGGHSGIGLELTKMLLEENAKIGIIIRNEQRKQAFLALNIPKAENIDFFYADLSIAKEIDQAGEIIRTNWPKVDVLFNNAGVLLEEQKMSIQGNEMHFEVNALAPIRLLQQLHPLLLRSKNPTVVNTSADGLAKKQLPHWHELRQPTKFTKLFGAYMNSKLAMTQWMKFISQSVDFKQIKIISASPGPNKTKMTSGKGMPTWLLPLRHLFFAKPTKGARLLFKAAFANDSFPSGSYLVNHKMIDMDIDLEVFPSTSYFGKGI